MILPLRVYYGLSMAPLISTKHIYDVKYNGCVISGKIERRDLALISNDGLIKCQIIILFK